MCNDFWQTIASVKLKQKMLETPDQATSTERKKELIFQLQDPSLELEKEREKKVCLKLERVHVDRI